MVEANVCSPMGVKAGMEKHRLSGDRQREQVEVQLIT